MDMRICYLDIWILLAVVKLGQGTILLPQVVSKFEIKKKITIQFQEKDILAVFIYYLISCAISRKFSIERKNLHEIVMMELSFFLKIKISSSCNLTKISFIFLKTVNLMEIVLNNNQPHLNISLGGPKSISEFWNKG